MSHSQEYFYIFNCGLERRTQQLRALASLTEDLGSIPRTHTVCGSTVCSTDSTESDALFWLLQAPGTHGLQRSACRQVTYTQIKIVLKCLCFRLCDLIISSFLFSFIFPLWSERGWEGRMDNWDFTHVCDPKSSVNRERLGWGDALG